VLYGGEKTLHTEERHGASIYGIDQKKFAGGGQGICDEKELTIL